MRRAATWTAALAAVLALAVPASAGLRIGNGNGGVGKEMVADGLDQPMYVTTAPDVSGQVYVVEREGTVRVVELDGDVLDPPFLDISGETTTDGERGLLSIAFDPGYQSNGLVYAYFTTNSGNLKISEFGTNSDTDANEGSEREVITIDHPSASNHNGGTIAFGADDSLYLATGDGGTGGDTAQDKTSLLGKLLRIDPHGIADGDYSVPADNPYVGVDGDDEIYARGLRNPFRWNFDPVSDKIAIGEVGQDRWEEIDYESPDTLRAANFGWNRMEGNHRYAGTKPKHHYRKPIKEYSHSKGNVITGGLVVRDENLPTLYRRYVYSDFSVGKLRSLKPRMDHARDDDPLGVHIDNPSSFGYGPDNEVFVTSLSDGKLFQIVPE
jgi:glucose/arabinose dehydrogenase